MVEGIKRFEGREWTHKYRGPLWIHSTSQKPSLETIKEVEGNYKSLYSSIGEDMPSFPDRYITGHLLGRIDLVDIIPFEEYEKTVEVKLREKTECSW
jgi:hypothetical protein